MLLDVDSCIHHCEAEWLQMMKLLTRGDPLDDATSIVVDNRVSSLGRVRAFGLEPVILAKEACHPHQGSCYLESVIPRSDIAVRHGNCFLGTTYAISISATQMAANQDGVIYVLSGCPVAVASCTYDIQSYHWFLLKYCKQLVMNLATGQTVFLGNIILFRTSSKEPQKILGSME
ncbi:hypothetical protein B0H13DRAFT_1860590 [Mycena leptocephala]|nr:hypothetical protein B0H13DRAFT_1860590 [Mycena leptocephala]